MAGSTIVGSEEGNNVRLLRSFYSCFFSLFLFSFRFSIGIDRGTWSLSVVGCCRAFRDRSALNPSIVRYYKHRLKSQTSKTLSIFLSVTQRQSNDRISRRAVGLGVVDIVMFQSITLSVKHSLTPVWSADWRQNWRNSQRVNHIFTRFTIELE